MADSPTQLAQDLSAPVAERYDAEAHLTKAALNSQLFPTDEMRATIDQIHGIMNEREELLKAGSNLIVGPWSGQAKKGKNERGPDSIFLDDLQIITQGSGYWERPGALSFLAMRAMVEATPILNSIIMTRQRQVMRFCRPQMGDSGPGFVIRHVDPTRELGDKENASIQLLQKFMLNCGWEFDARKRKMLKRDNFSQFMMRSVRDSLVMDSMPIETEMKRDKSLGMDGFYAVDGATIRLCTDLGYDGDDQIFAVQVIEGNVRTAYTHEQLIYEVRNPRTDVLVSGYGYSETEMLIRTITQLLNTITYNSGFFDKNSIPRGIMNLYGNYSPEDIAAFKRQWGAMVKGSLNAHNMPVMVSKDSESKADFVEIGGQMTEMAFGKWITFLTSTACAIYGVAPEEISMESFATQAKGLGGNDTEEKLVSANDKGLRPLLAHYENVASDFIIQGFSEDYMFRFVGLDDQDRKETQELIKIAATWNEARKLVSLDAVEGPEGDMPINASLIPTWTQVTGIGQPEQPEEDFGDPNGENSLGDGQDPAAAGEDAQPAGMGGPAPADENAGQDDGFGEPAGGLNKAFSDDGYGFPILKIEV
jgi:hypothetical protein